MFGCVNGQGKGSWLVILGIIKEMDAEEIYFEIDVFFSHLSAV